MNKKTLMEIRKNLSKMDKNLDVVNDTLIQLQNLFDSLEENKNSKENE